MLILKNFTSRNGLIYLSGTVPLLNAFVMIRISLRLVFIVLFALTILICHKLTHTGLPLSREALHAMGLTQNYLALGMSIVAALCLLGVFVLPGEGDKSGQLKED